MHSHEGQHCIKVLVADDDEHVLDCYRVAFSDEEPTNHMKALDALAAELFDPETDIVEQPVFEIVACSQGEDAVDLARAAADDGDPFDVVILDVRMPPGIDGVEAGSRIRALDPEVEIVFVTGYSDIPLEELQRRVPPPMKLHYFNKPLSFTDLANDVASMVKPH
ncbi:MAG: response regulator [Woeseiaceae bacterium]|nr:response regulator [Woeseiaceae bacterium]